VRYLRRAPREVYRVYDEEEFLRDAAQELAAGRGARGGLIALAGGALVLMGAAYIASGLLASGKKQLPRDARRRATAVAGDLNARVTRPRNGAGVEPGSVPRLVVASAGRRAEAGTRRDRGAAVRHRSAAAPRRPWREAISTGGGVERVVVAVEPPARAAQRPEFGFER